MQSRKVTVVALDVVLAVLAIAAVIVRLICRSVKRNSLGTDDYTVIVALVFTIGVSLTSLVCVFIGNLGGHDFLPDGKPAITLHAHTVRATSLWVGQWLSALAVGFTKISILFLYRRIFLGKVFLITTNIMVIISVVWTIAFVFANIFECNPVSAIYIAEKKGTCIEFGNMLLGQAISDILTDVLILVLPWYPVYHLKMPLSRKLAVCGIFLLGGFVIAAGIVRAVEVDVNFKNPSKDTGYFESTVNYWNTISVCVGVISACLPTMRPVLNSMGPESIIRAVQSKFSGSWSSKSRLADVESTRPSKSDGEGSFSNSPFIYSGEKPGSDHHERHQTFVQAVAQDNLRNPSDTILIESSFSHSASRT
ncbi:MAG: hypothetical protein MMC23_008416 [Stictis urceolatum]|nr:hypothetical protein [Stictis urceolata]